MQDPIDYALDQRDKDICKLEEQLENFNELTSFHFNTIDESLFHILNISESFTDIELVQEIRDRLMEIIESNLGVKDERFNQ